MMPLFIVDLRDRATGRAAAVRVTREDALLPLGALLDRVLRTDTEAVVRAGGLAPEQESSLFRLQDLAYPVRDNGDLADRPYRGLRWRHQHEGFPYDLRLPAAFERVRRGDAPDVLVLPLQMDRHDLKYERTWRGFHARRFHRFRPAFAQLLPHGRPDSPDRAAAYIEQTARCIWRADFENYSRFLPHGIPLKTGDETLERIAAGGGGVCTEKVLALKLITDAAGLDSRVVFAGPHTGRAPLPLKKLRAMLNELASYDFTYARRHMRYWDHVALEYRLEDGRRLLVDPSGGNIPFLCHPAGPFLDRRSGRRDVPVRMLAVAEPVTYHRVPEKLGLDFLFAWETWITDVELMQVFDNRLGLLVCRDMFVTPVVTGSATKRVVAIESWRRYATEHGLGMAVEGEPAGPAEAARFAELEALHPRAIASCRAALPGLEAKYRAYILRRHGIDKPFHADLMVLDRRPLGLSAEDVGAA